MPVSNDRDNCEKLMKNLLKDQQGVSALVFDNALENLLTDIIQKYFSRYDDHVKTFLNPNRLNITQKARLLYALKLIDETTLKDIKHIHNIRCIFAHSMPKSFANNEVRKECKELSTVTKNQKVTAKNSHDIFFNAVTKNLKHLALKLSKSDTYVVPLMSGMVLKIKPKKKLKRKVKKKAQQ